LNVRYGTEEKVGMSNALNRRIVITGMAAFSPLGLDLDAYWQSLTDAKSGIRPITSIDVSTLAVRFGGELPGFDAKKFFKKDERKSLKMMARTVQMGVGCAKLAFQNSGAARGSIDPTRFGIEFGSSLIPTELDDLAPAAVMCADSAAGNVNLGKWGTDGITQVPPLWMLKYLPNMVACHVSIMLDAQGPNNSVTESDAAALLALGEAARIIRRGQADFMLTGAADSKINPLSLVRQNLFAPLSRRNDAPAEACRPFDRDRDGWVVAEGAGMIVVEELEHARRRGARIEAEVIGFGSAFDRGRTGAGIARAVRAALDQAGIESRQLDHINAHGMSTVDGDAWEARGLREALGDNSGVTTFAPKSFFGSMSAAGSAVELIASVLALRNGTLPGTLNYATADPACPVTVCREPRPVAQPYALKIALTERGQAAAVVIRRWE
jgi:3-oxoacyl-[acyl-carrier-protein] synthase II